MGSPLVLLPGLMCDSRVWAAQLSGLSDASPWSPDGYGEAATITAMAERVLASAPPRMALAGHSMGARVALEMVRLAPDRIERLALLDTGVHPQRPGERAKRVALLELGRAEGMEAMIDAWLPPMVHPARRSDAAFLAPMRTMCIEAGLATYERQMEALLARPDGTKALGLVRVPTLLGVGRQDDWSPLAQHEEIAARLPDARLVVFEDSGHMAPVEAADQVNRALRQWLAA
jgi:pimeloyl-ACP methyl ester carboxylesterase